MTAKSSSFVDCERQARLRDKATRLLHHLIAEAETAKAYGEFGVRVFVEAGQITVIRRKYEATEK